MEQVIADEQLLQIAQTYGTPLYVYHAPTISRQWSRLQLAFAGKPVTFFYACKALTNLHVLKHMRQLGINIDCSSINEVHLALRAGFSPSHILYTSNGIAFAEIAEAVRLGVHVNIDSLSNLQKFGEAYGHSYPVGIRLRPNIMAGGNLKISTGHDRSKFGIPIEQFAEVQALVQQYHIHLRTLHIHTGSEIKDVEVFMQGIEVLFDILPQCPELEVIDLGGGFKVPYRKGEHGTDMEALAMQLEQALQSHASAKDRNLSIWFEPGKYLVSQCGFLLTTVNVLQQTAAATFAGVDSGFNHLIRPMFYDSYHYIRNISNPQGPEQPYAVVGNICETDTFAWDRKLGKVSEGDVLAIFNAGAYGFEMSSQYNSRFRPAEVLVEEGGEVRLIRRRDTLDDLVRNIPDA